MCEVRGFWGIGFITQPMSFSTAPSLPHPPGSIDGPSGRSNDTRYSPSLARHSASFCFPRPTGKASHLGEKGWSTAFDLTSAPECATFVALRGLEGLLLESRAPIVCVLGDGVKGTGNVPLDQVVWSLILVNILETCSVGLGVLQSVPKSSNIL